jgi:hypothetical protein
MMNPTKKASNSTLVWALAGLGGVIAIGTGVYFFLRKKDTASTSQDKGSQIRIEEHEKVSNKSGFAAKVKNEVGKSLVEEDELYTRESMLQTLKEFHALKYDDFKTLSARYRKARRAVQNDTDEYFKAGFAYFKEMSKLFTDDYHKLFEYNIVDTNKWVDSLREHQFGDSVFTSLMFETIQEWEKKLPSSKRISKAELLEVMDYEKELLRKEIQELDLYKDLIVQTGDVFEFLIITNSKMSDKTYQKYHIENEDTLAAADALGDDEQVKSKEEEILELTDKFIAKFEEIFSQEMAKAER